MPGRPARPAAAHPPRVIVLRHPTLMGPEPRIERLRAALAAAFPDAVFALVDESHLHAGHAGARSGRGHFRLDITSEIFAGLTPLARHRKVFAALDALMATDIHALSINAKTPAERLS